MNTTTMSTPELFEPLQPHEMAGMLKNKKAVQDFIFAGSAIFTIRNNDTGNRFTYKIKQSKRQKDKFFVSNLRGPEVYASMGAIIGPGRKYFLPFDYKDKRTDAAKEWSLNNETPFDWAGYDKEKMPVSMKAFMWFLNWYMSNDPKHAEFPKNIEIWHEGVCGRCGRRLTVPSSIETGFGPECIKYI